VRQEALAVYRSYDLSPETVQALEDGLRHALGRVGIHPVLQIHFLMARHPERVAHIGIRDYLPEIAVLAETA
jgi:hypothetical protein